MTMDDQIVAAANAQAAAEGANLPPDERMMLAAYIAGYMKARADIAAAMGGDHATAH